MEIIARDFRGLVSFEARFETILLLAGFNTSGKSSVCMAIGAAAAGEVLPCDVPKGKASLLVRVGAEDAAVSIAQTDGHADVHWPSAIRRTEGRFIDASLIAVGMDTPCTMTTRERAGWLIDTLHASPTREEFLQRMTELVVPADMAKAAWTDITKLGWDGAHAAAKEAGAKDKGAWERITRQRYGIQKALTWRPDGWTLDLETADEAKLIAEAEFITRQVEGERAKGAVEQAAYDSLQERAATLADADCARVQADAQVRQLTEEAAAARAAREALGNPVDPADTCPCPHCGAQVLIVGKLLSMPAIVSREALAAQRMDVAKADGHLTNRENALRQAQMAALQARGKVQAAEEARDRLRAIPEGATTIADTVARMQADLDVAADRIGMWRAQREATKLRILVDQRTTLVKQLAEDGLRQTMMAGKLEEFNEERLAVLSRGAGWPAVQIEPDLSLTLGGRPYSLCSESEKFRVRVTLQIAAAQVKREPMMVIDGADILDRGGRNGLLSLLASVGIPVVVGMTILRYDDMPDLQRAGIGVSLWIEDGITQHAADSPALLHAAAAE